MCKMIDQFADKIKGQFSFFDRMIINGYFRPLLSEQTRIGSLYAMGIPLRDFTEYFKGVTDRLVKQIEDGAMELGRPVVYLPSAKARKEDIAKDSLLSSPVDEGLICVLKTLEACRTAKIVAGKGNSSLSLPRPNAFTITSIIWIRNSGSCLSKSRHGSLSISRST